MYTDERFAANGVAVDDLIARFEASTRAVETERLAELLGLAGNHDAVHSLLVRLGDRRVQQDVHVEYAVCRALVALDVMCASGETAFALRPRHLLAEDVVEMIGTLDPPLPLRYLVRRGA
ncbi:MAG TPA: hypothetical protein VL119_05180 [Acidimicrobiia bacterium]|nr:hypothetical protein [Acidimicrobiia bacterium]